MHTYTHTYIRIDTYIHTCIHTHIHAHTYTHSLSLTHTHSHTTDLLLVRTQHAGRSGNPAIHANGEATKITPPHPRVDQWPTYCINNSAKNYS